MGRRPRASEEAKTTATSGVVEIISPKSQVVIGRSSDPTSNIKPADVYQRVIDFEEGEAKLRSADSDTKLFYETYESLRKLFKTIYEHKCDKPDADPSEISEARDKASLHIVTLKKLNRLEKLRTKAGHDALHKEKQKLDSMHLLLQNLLYEANHLDKEAKKCLQFKSKDEEIDLVAVEEFYKNAPEEVTRPAITKNNPHQLRLARLEWELRQRRELSEACVPLQDNYRKISSSLTEVQSRLGSLAPKLQDALNAAKPLQEALGLNSLSGSATRGPAKLLPLPLFLLHARSLAFSEAFGHDTVKVSIVGNEDEAYDLEQSNVTTIVSDSDSDQGGDEKEEEVVEKKKRHRRSTAKLTKKERANERLKLMLKVHPLKVTLIVKQKDVSIVLTFSFLINLKIVTVQSSTEVPKQLPGISAGDVLNSQSILQALYPNDLGLESPHPATSYILKCNGIDGDFSQYVPELGRPYIWAQRMCGLDFLASDLPNMGEKMTVAKLPGEPCSKLCVATIENVLVELKKNLKRRLNLMSELLELETGNLPPFEGTGASHVRLMGSLTQWQSISWSEYSQASSVNNCINLGLVSQNDMFYRAIITRQSAKLVALVAVKSTYPKQAPIFSLTLHWNGTHCAKTDDDIRDIERCVNTNWGTLDTDKPVTLAGQITKLIACMDILLEAVGSSEFLPDKVVFRPVKGRTRTKPYKFLKQGSGVFVQY